MDCSACFLLTIIFYIWFAKFLISEDVSLTKVWRNKDESSCFPLCGPCYCWVETEFIELKTQNKYQAERQDIVITKNFLFQICSPLFGSKFSFLWNIVLRKTKSYKNGSFYLKNVSRKKCIFQHKVLGWVLNEKKEKTASYWSWQT